MSAVVSFKDSSAKELDIPTQLPEPTGYRMLVAPLEVDEKTEGGIILPDERRDAESAASVVACVIKQGSSAYKDIKKFPDGPWCENGDWVLIPSYAGTRILVQGMQFRIINDDTVHAVVEDPRGVSRA